MEYTILGYREYGRDVDFDIEVDFDMARSQVYFTLTDKGKRLDYSSSTPPLSFIQPSPQRKLW